MCFQRPHFRKITDKMRFSLQMKFISFVLVRFSYIKNDNYGTENEIDAKRKEQRKRNNVFIRARKCKNAKKIKKMREGKRNKLMI